MHKGLYWSQLITGIGIGLIVAALVWIFVPQFFPGLEDTLNQMVGMQTDETVPMTDQEFQDPLDTEGKYSHLFEDREKDIKGTDQVDSIENSTKVVMDRNTGVNQSPIVDQGAGDEGFEEQVANQVEEQVTTDLVSKDQVVVDKNVSPETDQSQQEDQTTQLQIADTTIDTEETTMVTNEEPSQVAQGANLAQKTDEAIEELFELNSSVAMNKENKAFGEETDRQTESTQEAEINQLEEKNSTSLVSPQSTENDSNKVTDSLDINVIEAESEQVDPQVQEENSEREGVVSEVTEATSTQAFQNSQGSTNNTDVTVDQMVATVFNSSEEETYAQKSNEPTQNEPEIVTLADLKVYELEIDYGDTAKDIAKKLEQFELAHRKDFLKLISLQKLERKLKVGKYYIKHGTSLVDIIDELTSN